MSLHGSSTITVSDEPPMPPPPARAATPARPAAPPPGARPLRLPERPVAGTIALRRAREAVVERTVLGAGVLLALTVGGLAGYAITGRERPYAVQAVLPAQTAPFAWKRSPAQATARTVDLDPVTTGALPDRRAAEPEPPPSAAQGAYALRRVSGGQAELEGDGRVVRVAAGDVLPGAGRVLAIRNTGAGWVVITTETIIGPTP